MLKGPNADMVHGARTEAWVEILCSQRFEVFNDPWPQMEDVIPGKKVKSRQVMQCPGLNHLVKEVLFSMTVTLAPKS